MIKIKISVFIQKRITAMRAMLAMRVIPNGADKPLPELPAEVDIDPDDKSAERLWDKYMQKYKGMLNATVKNKQRFES